MKISKRQLKRIIKEEQVKLVREANLDGTYSADEGDLEDALADEVMMELDNLIARVREESMQIGGNFRGPGIKARIFAEMRDMLMRTK